MEGRMRGVCEMRCFWCVMVPVRQLSAWWWGHTIYPPTMTMTTQGENAHVMCEWPREVRNGHTRWKCPCEVRMAMHGENAHARWEMAMWGGKWPYKLKMLMWGENGHVRWKCPCKVRMAIRGEKQPRKPPSKILHSLIFVILVKRILREESVDVL